MQKGSVLIEVVVGAAVLAAVALAFVGSMSALGSVHERDMLYIKGDLLAEEGLEATRLVKDEGWSVLSSAPRDTPLGLSLGASTWSIAGSPDETDGSFERTIHIHSVYRDAAFNIASSGTLDPDTLLVESTVSWAYHGEAQSVTYTAYVANI